MAQSRQSFEATAITETTLDGAIRQLNGILARLDERIDTLAGLRGTPKFHSAIDAGGNRLMNVGDPEDDSDVETKRHSLRADSPDEPFDARGKPVRNVGLAVLPDDAVPLRQLQEEATTAVVTAADPPNSAIADLTDATGGTANDALQAIPDPADTPADADALREDIVANLLPPIRNNYADLRAKVNAILAVMRDRDFIET